MKVDEKAYLKAPLVLHPGSFDVPDALKKMIVAARIKEGKKVLEEEMAHEVEALLYLHSASLVMPLDEDAANVYAYLFAKYFPDHAHVVDAPEELSDYEKHLLKDLRRKIYAKQVRYPRRVKGVKGTKSSRKEPQEVCPEDDRSS